MVFSGIDLNCAQCLATPSRFAHQFINALADYANTGLTRAVTRLQSACSPESQMKELTPPSIAPPFARYAHGVLVPEAAKLVFTSGQLALTKDGETPDDAHDQAAVCFCNIDAILEEAGVTRADVVRINAFVTDREHMKGYMSARDAWLARLDRLPASTLMIVNGFTRPEFKVEVEIIAAVLPD